MLNRKFGNLMSGGAQLMLSNENVASAATKLSKRKTAIVTLTVIEAKASHDFDFGRVDLN